MHLTPDQHHDLKTLLKKLATAEETSNHEFRLAYDRLDDWVKNIDLQWWEDATIIELRDLVGLN